MFKNLLGLAVLALLAAPAAQAVPINVVLSGQVAADCTLSGFTADLGWDTLTIQAGVVNKRLGFALVNCNASTGFKVTGSSSSGGTLRNVITPTSQTPYTISMGGGAFYNLMAPTEIYNSGPISPGSPFVNTQVETRVNVTALPGAVTGTYTDTMTLTLTVN